MKRIFLVPLFLILFFYGVSSAGELTNLESIQKTDRILILAPHPDDEAIGCAGIIQEALKRKARVKIVYLTNGDHNQLAFIVYEKRLVFRKGEFIHMGEVRRQEALKAMSYLGLGADDLIFLGYPDFGTFAMFTRYWKSSRPFKNLLTRLKKVPYPENFSYGKSYIPENILTDLEKIIEGYRPTRIFVSHPADTNGDHKTLALLLDVALWDLEGKMPLPRTYNYLVHHLGWPLPRKYHPELEISVPQDLENSGRWLSFKLNPDMVSKKYNSLRGYKSQTESSGFYLFSFARSKELFQGLPLLDLTSPGEAVKADMFAAYLIKDGQLNIILSHPTENHDISRAAIYLFGWRKDVVFSDMPKIFLDVRSNTITVFNGNKRIKAENVSSAVEGQNTIIKVPLELLNNPQKGLISARIFSKAIPYVQGIWNKIKFE